MSSKGKIAKAAGVMSAATFISRVLGYIKDMILAGFFGASSSADVFFVAFRIPNLLRELFAEGSMSSAFVPVLTEYRNKQGEEEANRLVNVTFIFIVVFVGIICLLGILFAPQIVTLIAPGFLKDPAKFENSVLLTRIMFPFLLCTSLAALVMGALNTKKIFFIPALAPALLNIVTIVCVVALSSKFANPIISVAVGVTAGGLVQVLFQIPSFVKSGYRIRWIASFREIFNHPGLKKIGTLIIPSTAGMAVSQINIFVSTILASYLVTGSITYLYYSMRLIQFPIGIFGVAMSMAVLPALSEHAVNGDFVKLKDDFSFALRLLFFITVPAMAGLIALKLPIVNTLFQRGLFGHEATVGTSEALMFYALGIWAIVGVRVVTAAFYSMQDTKTPVKIAAAGMAINIGFSLVLMGPMKHSGLALANSIAACCNFLLLFYFLRKRLGGVGTKRIAVSFSKTLMASAVMAAIGLSVSGSDIWTTSGSGMQKAFYLGGSIVFCLGVFGISAYLLKCDEMFFITGKIKDKFGGKGCS
ncbi:MAG: murein biosynthesis integral membrane protein MurJ [Nitrospirae bacterium]|nr:MAG: murein biosynthesis integral membrane protein MurJ [Nitrospirota bacterium]